jgi:hypothetical protein
MTNAEKRKPHITWGDLVRKHIPDATSDEVEYILWNETAYPMADADYVEKQIIEYANRMKSNDRAG